MRTALDGPTALGLAEQHPPDVVLLDVGMPGMDGYEVARRLRQLSEMRDTTIVAITGYGGAVHRAHAAAAGFDHHLLKPVTLDALERLLDEA